MNSNIDIVSFSYEIKNVDYCADMSSIDKGIIIIDDFLLIFKKLFKVLILLI